MRASLVDRWDWNAPNATPEVRRLRVERQLRLSYREAEQFALVGAWRAARHWRKRAARLQARLDRL